MRIDQEDLTESELWEHLSLLKDLCRRLPVHSPVAELVGQLASALEGGREFTAIVGEKDLSPNEAAKLLGISRPHLMEKYVRTGLLEAGKVGTHYRISASAVADFIERRERAAQDVAEAISHSYETRELDLRDEDLEELAEL